MLYVLWSSLVGHLALVRSFIQLIKNRSLNDLKASTDLVFDDECHATEVRLPVLSRREDKNFLDGRTICWTKHRLSVFFGEKHTFAISPFRPDMMYEMYSPRGLFH